MPKLKLLIRYAFIIGLSWFAIHQVAIIYDGLTDELNTSDVGLVLGNQVHENGEVSKRLKARLDRALELYNKQVFGKIIVSGGLGIEGHYEGTVMRDYLVEYGVNAEDIIIDDEGVNTHATAVNYKILQAKYRFKSVLIISQFYHISRTRLALRKVGIEGEINAAHAHYFEAGRDVYACFREFFGYYKYLLQ